MQNSQTDAILEGKILPLTIKLALPIAISQLLLFFYLFIDTLFIARIDLKSTSLLSGTGLIFPILFIFYAISMGITVGVSSLIARGIGEKNKEIIERSADSGLIMIFSFCIITMVIGYLFTDNIIHILAGDKLSKEAITHAYDYLIFFLPGLGFILLQSVLLGILQGEGLTKYIGISSLIAFLVNIILDPLLIFTANLGVSGAAIATSIANFLSFLYLVSVFIKNKSAIPIKWNVFQAKKSLMFEIIRIGFPQSLTLISISIMILILNNFVSSIGEIQMNAWTIAIRTDRILMIPISAIPAVTITMIGQNFGKKNIARIKEIYKIHLIATIILTLALACIYSFLAPFLFALMSDVKIVIDAAVFQVRAVSFTFIGVAVSYVSGSVFQATGRAMPSFLLQVFRIIIIIVPLSYVLAHTFQHGLVGLYIGFGTGNILALIISLLWTFLYIKKLK